MFIAHIYIFFFPLLSIQFEMMVWPTLYQMIWLICCCYDFFVRLLQQQKIIPRLASEFVECFQQTFILRFFPIGAHNISENVANTFSLRPFLELFFSSLFITRFISNKMDRTKGGEPMMIYYIVSICLAFAFQTFLFLHTNSKSFAKQWPL